MFELDMSNLEESLKQCRKEMDERKHKILAVVDPFLTPELDSKKQTELGHIAKFVLDRGCAIVSMMERPDFIISQNDRTIGVEIRQLNTSKAEYNGYIQNLFDVACRVFTERFPQHKLLVNFWISPNFIYKGSEKASLIVQIVDFVHECAEGLEAAPPSFIDRIDIQPHTGISFHFNEGGYTQEPINSSVVVNAIREKEKKIAEYIENSGTPIQWLLLVNKEVGSDSFDTYDFEGIDSAETRFEHVFLLKDFDSEVIELF